MANNSFEECKGLSGIEEHFVEIYTGPIYKVVNEFMMNRDSLDTYQGIRTTDFANYFYTIIVNSNNNEYRIVSQANRNHVKPIIQSKCNNIEWFQGIIFKYMMTLYGAILKCPRQAKEVTVYRGVHEHYMAEDPKKEYYLNTFTSTSIEKNTAKSFTNGNNNNEDSGILYHFIVKPGVECMYIGDIEAELLINPYQKYVFLSKTRGNYFYSILPSDVQPPIEFNEFSQFKNTIVTRFESMDGGEYTDHPIESYRRVQRTKRAKRSKLARGAARNKTKKTTEQMRKEKRRIAREHFKARMNLPIGSFTFGRPLSEEDRIYVEDLKRRLNL